MADTKEILEAAEKLGKLIADHSSIKKYTEAAKAVSADPEASRLFADFDREVMVLSQQEQSGQPISAAQRQKLQTLQTTIASNLKVKSFSIAQVEMTELLRKVSQAWQRPVAEVQQSSRGSSSGGSSAPASGSPRLVVPG